MHNIFESDRTSDKTNTKAVNRRKSNVKMSSMLVASKAVKNQAARRRRMTSFTVISIALAGLIWGSVLGFRSIGRVLFTENDDYLIQQVICRSDGRLATPARIKEWSEVQPGMNLFEVDIASIREHLETRVPVISTVTVKRHLPDTIEIQVNERQGLAQLEKNIIGVPLDVDKEGYVLGPSAKSSKLPVIVGYRQAGLRPGSFVEDTSLKDALDVLRICDETSLGQYVVVEQVSVGHPDFLDLRLKGDVRVTLAKNRYQARLAKVAGTLEYAKQNGRLLKTIDATGERNFPIEYR